MSTFTLPESRELLSSASKFTSLDTLMNAATYIQDNCEDFSVTNATWRNIAYNGVNNKLTFIPDDKVAAQSFSLTRYSLSQLCSKLGVPILYIERCFESGNVDLVTTNILTWLSELEKNLFIRTYKVPEESFDL